MKILLIGCGKMGSAMLSGWKRSGISGVEVIDPALGKEVGDLPKNYAPDYIVIAIKPQEMEKVLPTIAKFGGKVISIAAGKKIKFIMSHMGKRTIIRAMPNLPAVLGQGVTGAFANKQLTTMERKQVTQILSAFGELVWVKKESEIDSVTAISGSGPAYLFLFAEGMMEAAEKFGFNKVQAKQLVFTTLKGSLNLAEKSGLELSELINNVASKGGTTEAALKVFKKKNFKKIIGDAANAAKKRSMQLSDK